MLCWVSAISSDVSMFCTDVGMAIISLKREDGFSTIFVMSSPFLVVSSDLIVFWESSSSSSIALSVLDSVVFLLCFLFGFPCWLFLIFFGFVLGVWWIIGLKCADGVVLFSWILPLVTSDLSDWCIPFISCLVPSVVSFSFLCSFIGAFVFFCFGGWGHLD